MVGVLWPDAEITSVVVDYDAVSLSVRETTGREVEVRCVGHIGYCIEGFWDEVVVHDADLVESHPFMDRCLRSLKQRLGEDLPPSGSPTRNAGPFSTLVLTLGDAARLLVTAAVFEATVRVVPPQP